MKKIAGVPLVIIGGAMVLLALLIGTEDDGAYANVPRAKLSTLLIAYPMLVVGFGVMISGAGLLLSTTGVGQQGEKATFARQPAAATAMLPPIENSIGMLFKVLPAGSFVMRSPKSEYGQYNYVMQRTETIASQCPTSCILRKIPAPTSVSA